MIIALDLYSSSMIQPFHEAIHEDDDIFVFHICVCVLRNLGRVMAVEGINLFNSHFRVQIVYFKL